MGGALSILASVPFFLAGFETIPQGVESSGGDKKSVGKTVILTVVLSCLFYALLLVTLGGALPWKEFVGFNSPAAALLFKEIYGGTFGTLLYMLILIGAICGLLTTWNGFMMASSQILMAMARVSIVPDILAKQHPKYGTPIHALKVSFIASLIGPFLGSGLIGSLTTFSAAGYVISWMITAFCLIKLRRSEPELKRPYRIPGGVATAWFAGLSMATLLILLFIPNQPVYMGKMATMLFFGWMMIGVGLFILDYRQRHRYSKLKRASFLFASMVMENIGDPAFINLFEDDYRIISFVVPKDTSYSGQSLMELGWGKNQNIFIVKIEHGTEMLMLPTGVTKICTGDRVFAAGLTKSVYKFSNSYDIGTKYTINTMKDFMGFGSTERQSPLTCIEVKVSASAPFCNKPIKKAGIQEDNHCMVIGIKRDGETIMMPRSDIVICEEDVLWVLGEEYHLEHLCLA